MLHQETVASGTLVLIRKLMDDKNLDQFNLVGGTALALQLGHRISVDIDLFTNKPFDAGKMSEHLSHHYQATDFRGSENSVNVFIENVKIDLLAHQYPQVNPSITIERIQMSSLEDIAAMKFNAIT